MSLIPNSKFSQPQNPYSFIAYFNQSQNLAEIHLPPVAIAPDFSNWFQKNKFKQKSEKSDRAFAAELNKKNQELVLDLVSKSKANGAYLAEDINQLEDRVNDPKSTSSIKSKLEQLLENKIGDAIARIKEENLSIAKEKDLIIANLRTRIESLEQQLAIANAKLSEYEEFVGEGTTIPISPFGSGSSGDNIQFHNRVFSPFAPELDIEDNTYLSSPYSGNADEILDPEDYDEEEFNELNSPADFSNKESSLDKLDISDLKDADKTSELDLDKALDLLESKEDNAKLNGSGKPKDSKGDSPAKKN